jgi:putative ABC transport system permease protein
MMMAMRERTNEFAVLKTLGFADGAIFAAVLAEAAVITLVGGVPGALFAKFLLEQPGVGIPNVMPMIAVHWNTVVTGIVVAAAMGAVSGLVPAWQAARLKIVDALRKVG